MLITAAVVVLYNPNMEVLDNIKSYLHRVNKLFVVDNSEKSNDSFVKEIKLYKNVTYISYNNNLGVASALNLGAEKAIEEGYEYLLTMDQDSRISENLILEMCKELKSDQKLAVVSPFVVHEVKPEKPNSQGLEKLLVAITSGSMVRLSSYQKIGGFLEKLFIDYVDHEFCLRINLAGFKVMQLNSVYVYHKLGEMQTKNFFYRKVYPTNHSPLRWYYRTRNRLYVYRKYKDLFPEYVKSDKRAFFRELLKLLFFEKEKLKKMKMIFLGFNHYLRNIYGRYDNK